MRNKLPEKHGPTKDPKEFHVGPTANHLLLGEIIGLVHGIVKDDLDQVTPPDHLRRVNEVLAKDTGHTITDALGGDDQEQRTHGANTMIQEQVCG